MIRGLVAFRKDTMASAVRLLARAGVAVAVTIGLAGCWTIPVQNPNFPATEREIEADLARMEREPVRLERPVIVLSGYRSPHPVASRLAERLRELSDRRPRAGSAIFRRLAAHFAGGALDRI